MPIHGRQKISVESAKRLLARQKVNVIVVMVGDETNRETAKLAGVDFLERPNKPVWKKVNEAVTYSKRYDPDAVMFCGSDDWFSDNWLEVAFRYFKKGKYFLAGRHVNIVSYFMESYTLFKSPSMYFESGEVVHRRVLDKIDWNIQHSSMDLFTGAGRLKLFTDRGFTRVRMSEVEILCIDGGWEALTGLNVFVKRHGANKIRDPDPWLSTHFPDIHERMKRVLC